LKDLEANYVNVLSNMFEGPFLVPSATHFLGEAPEMADAQAARLFEHFRRGLNWTVDAKGARTVSLPRRLWSGDVWERERNCCAVYLNDDMRSLNAFVTQGSIVPV
jgi:hypothetical protein